MFIFSSSVERTYSWRTVNSSNWKGLFEIFVIIISPKDMKIIVDHIAIDPKLLKAYIAFVELATIADMK